MNFTSRGSVSLIGILAMIGFGMIAAAGCSLIVSPTPTANVELINLVPTESRPPTVIPTETKTSTPAPTYTLVIQPGTPLPSLGVFGPTLTPTVPYNVAGITPVVPLMKNPIGFASPFKIVTYPVTGSTVDQLSASLEKGALKDAHDPFDSHYALTSWFLSATWEEKPSQAGCEVAHAMITMTITMTLPALSNPSNLPPDVAKRWDNFVSNTITHEMGHVKLGIDGATEYRRALGNFLPAMSCDLLKLQLNNLFKNEYAQIDNANVDYDKQTNHGATQGAVFP